MGSRKRVLLMVASVLFALFGGGVLIGHAWLIEVVQRRSGIAASVEQFVPAVGAPNPCPPTAELPNTVAAFHVWLRASRRADLRSDVRAIMVCSADPKPLIRALRSAAGAGDTIAARALEVIALDACERLFTTRADQVPDHGVGVRACATVMTDGAIVPPADAARTALLRIAQTVALAEVDAAPQGVIDQSCRSFQALDAPTRMLLRKRNVELIQRLEQLCETGMLDGE